MALALGAEDFSASHEGVPHEKKGLEISMPAMRSCWPAAARDRRRVGSVFFDINDMEGLREDTALTKNLGFDGNTVVHPRQVDIVNAYFTPSQKEISVCSPCACPMWKKAKRMNKGAITLDGSMIDKTDRNCGPRPLWRRPKAAGIKVGGVQ
jgi:citrate lyase subunit beta/citryl-CoA lyase